MRIHEGNYPILAYLKNPDKGIGLKIPAEEMAESWDRFDKFFADPHATCPIFSSNIDIVSKPFIEAAWRNREKIMTDVTFHELLKSGDVHGTLIVGGYITLYWFHLMENGDVGHKTLTCCNEYLISINDGYGKYLVKRDYKEKLNQDIQADSYDYFPIFFHLFKKYATVETVDALSNKKVKAPDGEKILNESWFNMKYTDCSWFRTIIRKEGFMVRGHFKMQPYKNEKKEWDYKLIYIEPYQKHGYVRTAKKVVEERKFINEK